MIIPPRVEGVAPLPGREETFTCRICRRTFPKNAPNQRHCSRECRKEADRRRAAARHRRLNRGAHHREASA
jgi:hypothetical protein